MAGGDVTILKGRVALDASDLDKVSGKAKRLMRDLDNEVSGKGAKQTRFKGIADDIDNLAGRSKVGRLALDELGDGAGLAAGGMAAVATGALAAGAAVLGLAVKSVQAFQSFAQETKRFSQVTGASAEEASVFLAVLDDFEISGEQGAKALGFLGRNIVNNEKKFDEYGVTIARTRGGNADLVGTFMNLAGTIRNTTDPAQRLAIATGLLGRAGKDLLPILTADKALLDAAFGDAQRQKLMQQDIENSEKLRLALDSAGDEAQIFLRTIGAELVPVLAEATFGFIDVAQAVGRFVGRLKGVGASIASQVPLVAGLASGFKLLSKLGKDDAKRARDQAAARERLNGVLTRSKEKTDELAKAVDDAFDAQQSAISAAFSEERAKLGLREANASLIDAEKALAELRAGPSADIIADAENRLRDARHSASRASDEVVDAQTALNVARLASGPGSEQARQAEQALADARHAATQATDGVSDAQAELAKLRTPAGIQEVAAAERAVEAAQLAVKDAVFQTASAAVNLQEQVDLANGKITSSEEKAKLFRQVFDDVGNKQVPTINSALDRTTEKIPALERVAEVVKASLEDSWALNESLAMNAALAGAALGAAVGGAVGTRQSGPIAQGAIATMGAVAPPRAQPGPIAAGAVSTMGAAQQPRPAQVNVYTQTNADPNEIGRAVAWASR